MPNIHRIDQHAKIVQLLAPPADIAHATLRLAAFLYKQRSNYDVDQDRPLLTGEGVMVMPVQIPRDVRAILDPYRRITL